MKKEETIFIRCFRGADYHSVAIHVVFHIVFIKYARGVQRIIFYDLTDIFEETVYGIARGHYIHIGEIALSSLRGLNIKFQI